ncbi:MAG: response regulator [Opitutaceae bacterium]|jgi:two-component system response regulator YesN
MNILIVDDDPGYREMLHAHLSRHHELSLLTNGRNALAVLTDDDHGFDVILLDLHMPRMSGSKLIEVLNEWNHLKSRFIIMSGMPKIDHVVGLPNVFAVLRKPFELPTLDALISQAAALPVLQSRYA